MRSVILELKLADFRSYDAAVLAPAGRSVFLWGPNGAGKTNVLEAISLLSPGRGLRGAQLSEIGRRGPAEADGAPWAVSARIVDGEGELSETVGDEAVGIAPQLTEVAQP